MLEAARWAPSAGNHQPSRFLVGRAGSSAFVAVVEALRPGNRTWAADAPLLVVGAARLRNDDGTERSSGPFELGLAVGQLITQAHALGLERGVPVHLAVDVWLVEALPVVHKWIGAVLLHVLVHKSLSSRCRVALQRDAVLDACHNDRLWRLAL